MKNILLAAFFILAYPITSLPSCNSAFFGKNNIKLRKECTLIKELSLRGSQGADCSGVANEERVACLATKGLFSTCRDLTTDYYKDYKVICVGIKTYLGKFRVKQGNCDSEVSGSDSSKKTGCLIAKNLLNNNWESCSEISNLSKKKLCVGITEALLSDPKLVPNISIAVSHFETLGPSTSSLKPLPPIPPTISPAIPTPPLPSRRIDTLTEPLPSISASRDADTYGLAIFEKIRIPMQAKYVGEERGEGLMARTWERENGIGSWKVIYFSDSQLEDYEIDCVRGQIVNSNNGKIHFTIKGFSGSGGEIFVAQENSRSTKGFKIFAYAGSLVGRFHHSSLGRGKPVLSAGEIEVGSRGKVNYVNNGSGHYLPGDHQLGFIVDYLDKKGCLDPGIEIELFGNARLTKIKVRDIKSIFNNHVH